MSFVCFNRVTVTGIRPAVLRFRDDARRRLPPTLKKVIGQPSVAFSFERLFHKNHVPAPLPDGIPLDAYRDGKDTWTGHCFTSALRLAEWHCYARVEYEIEVKNYEIYDLLTPLSCSYPELCFVDSEISLDSGDINCMYISRGRCSRWTLPEHRSDEHWQRAAKKHGIAELDDAYEDDDVRSDAEEGMLAEAMAHWDKHVLRVLRRRYPL